MKHNWCFLTRRQSFRENEFFLKMEEDSTGRWHFLTVGFGTEEELSRYFFNIRLFKDKISHTFQGPVISIDKPRTEVLKQRDGLVLDFDSVKGLSKKKCNILRELSFDFDILHIWFLCPEDSNLFYTNLSIVKVQIEISKIESEFVDFNVDFSDDDNKLISNRSQRYFCFLKGQRCHWTKINRKNCLA